MLNNTTFNFNPVMAADSYKYSHPSQYPTNMSSMLDYISARYSTMFKKICFVGLQPYLHILSMTITKEHVTEAATYAKLHSVKFELDGWMYIVNELQGKLPIKIKAAPEGSVLPVGLPLVVVEATDTKVPWIVGWTETMLLKVTYPIGVASKSLLIRDTLEKYGVKEWAEFALHMFGDRASHSIESASIAGMAHAAIFKGTDNFHSLKYVNDNYGVPGELISVHSYSVWASEHSTTSSNGRDNEEAWVYQQLLNNPDQPIMSFVADTYDVFNFVHFCTDENSRIRKLIESRPNQKLVMRPDSGDPIEVLNRILNIMKLNKLDLVTKNKHTLFKQFGLLWSDGIDTSVIENILNIFLTNGFAAENFVFGMGGNLVTGIVRDDIGMAMKCSNITLKVPHASDEPSGDEVKYTYEEREVFKDPITDPGKKSLKGKVTTYYNSDKDFYFVGRDDFAGNRHTEEVLKPVFENGLILKRFTLEEIRENTRK